MVDIAVSTAAALIALAIAVLQFILPNTLAFLLAGNLGESQSAVSWSVASRLFLGSDWPLFLRSEATSSKTVPRRIAVLTWAKPLGLLFLAVAAVITPLGLTDGLYPSRQLHDVVFVYARDDGPIGLGTPDRSTTMGFSRLCFGIICPGEPDLGNYTFITTINGTNRTNTGTIRTPEIIPDLVDLFQSGANTQSPTLSGFFDVQYRQYSTNTAFDIVDNSSFLVATYEPLTSLITDGGYHLVEGLIVDMVNPRIGFRNHSVPTGLQYGAQWEEDILFLEPETVCVNMNITLSTTSLGADGVITIQGMRDHGGFANISRVSPYSGSEYPYPDERYIFPSDSYPFADGQQNPKLYDRAYYAAWATNIFGMQYLNLTDPRLTSIQSEVGQLHWYNISVSPRSYNSILMKQDLGMVINAPSAGFSPEEGNNPRILNPYNVTMNNFSSLESYLQTSYVEQKVNISGASFDVAALWGIATRTDDNGDLSLTHNATWDVPIYMCAATTKLSVKNVQFRYNGTKQASLADLEIISIDDKIYDDQSKQPLWGLETNKPAYNLSQIDPLFGFIDNSKSESANLSTLRSSHLYIPASYASSDDDYTDANSRWGENMPLIPAPPNIWSTVMNEQTTGYDYTGQYNGPLSLMWKSLTQNATGAAHVLNLMWTDYAANYLVGTKGVHTTPFKQPWNATTLSRRQNTADNQQSSYPVHVVQYRVRYNWLYGIPALICVAFVGLAVLLALGSAVLGRIRTADVQHYLFNLTAGRILASATHPDGREHSHAETKVWIEAVGHRKVQIPGLRERVNRDRTTDGKGDKQYFQVRQVDDTDHS